MSIRRVRRLPGVSQAGIGMTIVADILMLFGFTVFLVNKDAYPHLWSTVAAWGILIAAVIVGEVFLWRFGDSVPRWSFPAWLAMLAAVAALGIYGYWGSASPTIYPTAALATGAGLLIATTIRPATDIVWASAALAAVLIATVVAQNQPDLLSIAPYVIVIAVAVCPPILGAKLVHRFRRLIQRELDLAYSQSTAAIGPLSVGMEVSDDLVRLDLEAERLLEAVASGQTKLPLEPQSASIAASLATELRLRLLQDHRHSWLDHAIEESEILDPSVALVDPHTLANLLSANQREGLLAAIWLLVSGPRDPKVRVEISTDAISAAAAHAQRSFPITISSTGVQKRRIDREAWHAMRRVGLFSDSARDANLHVVIECVVSAPEDR